MPKLARDARYGGENYAHVYDYSSYANARHRALREANRPQKHKKNKKRAVFQFLISLSVLGLIAFYVLPYSYKHITGAIFNPDPYKHIQTDIKNLAFPTLNYLSNTWFDGHRGFAFSANEKIAQMLPIKENVSMPVLTQELQNLAGLYPTVKPSVYVWDYETGNYVDLNASENYATASIIKIPVLIDVFKSIESGQFSLEDTIPLTEYYRTEGSGNLQFKAENSLYTIDELARRMITESDNSATNMLIAKVGSMTDVNQSIRSWGLKDTYISNWLPDLKGTNRTSAREMAQILYNIDENEKILSQESRTRIFNYMGHVHNDRLIKAGLGQGAVFLHKTGDIGTMLGDAGIVIAPNGKKYIIVILANRPHNSVAGKDFIVQASKIVYNYMVK